MQFLNDKTHEIVVHTGGHQLVVKPGAMIALDKTIGLAYGLAPLEGVSAIAPPKPREGVPLRTPPPISSQHRHRRATAPPPVEPASAPPDNPVFDAPSTRSRHPEFRPAPLNTELAEPRTARPAVPPGQAGGHETFRNDPATLESEDDTLTASRMDGVKVEDAMNRQQEPGRPVPKPAEPGLLIDSVGESLAPVLTDPAPRPDLRPLPNPAPAPKPK